MDSKKHLLLDRRFWPTFWTQFFGAFNDNVYKNALVVLITYKSLRISGLSPESMVAICGGIFILPFFLFSALAGQISDKYPKHRLMFLIKVWEIFVMVLGAVGFYLGSLHLLLFTLFFMGLQSAFFGPVKYSILPEIVSEDQLVQGNALVEMGTFVAILLGTIVGGVLISIDGKGELYVGFSVLIFAIIGTFFSKKITPLKKMSSDLKISFGLFRPTLEILRITKKVKRVYLSVLGISWLCFLGAALLSMFPGYVKNVIGGNEHIVTLFLGLFSIGVAIGSILCEKLSRDRLELGLVPFGTIGLFFFIFDLYLVGRPERLTTEIIGLTQFFENPAFYRVLIDLLGLSIFSGFFTVPLYTFVQHKSCEDERSRVIAGLNIINAFFMVASAILLIVLYSFDFSMPQIFGIFAILNLFVAIYIYSLSPEFLLRFFAMIISRFSYRVKVIGHEKIPKESGCILTCNHVSFADWLIIAASIKRPVRFVMYYKFMKIPIIKFLFRDAKIIPIAGKNEDETILNQAMLDIEQALEAGDVICLFPEGAITKNGKLDTFKTGIEKIIAQTPVPVIPMSVKGVCGSFFSRKDNGKALSNPSLLFKRGLRKVELQIYDPWEPHYVTAKDLENFTKEKIGGDV
jgi:1-acyl-sn-glycerol-3-phosphate acyltransferase